MTGKWNPKDKKLKHHHNRGPKQHITMVAMAKAAGVQPCTIQQNVNILMKYVIPQMT